MTRQQSIQDNLVARCLPAGIPAASARAAPALGAILRGGGLPRLGSTKGGRVGIEHMELVILLGAVRA